MVGVVYGRRQQLLRREQRVGVRADGEEWSVPKVEKAGEADHDVEPDREEHVRPGVPGERDEVRAALLRVERRGGKDERDDEQDSVKGGVAVAKPLAQPQSPEA